MENAEVEKSTSSEETSQLNRNRSFKSKQLVRSQAIRESQSPPRALSPAQHDTCNVACNATCNVADDVTADSEMIVSVAGNASDNSSHFSDRSSDVISISDVKNSDNDDFKKKQPVEIQITSGAWESEALSEQCGGPRGRWLAHAHSESSRDLLSNSPRVACVCGACANCPHCRGRRRRHRCPTKQDSGIVCSDDCPDWSDTELTGNGSNNNVLRKSGSLDAEDQTYYCRCPERKDRPKNISLSKNDSDDRSEPTGQELVNFIKDTLNKNSRDRIALLRIEKELHALINDTGRCIVRFPVMTSYGRMLVHRCASLFQLSHHLDHNNKTAVLVSKSGTSGGRIPCTSFKEWCVATFPPSPQRHPPDAHAKSILKRDTHSLDEPGTGALASNRSKSLEQRERDYERVRRRIFSTDNCSQQDESQWPWLNSGPVKVLTPETGRNKLLKVQSLEGSGSGSGGGGGSSSAAAGSWRARGAVSKSHSFGGYAHAEPAHHHHHHQHQHHEQRLLSRQGDLASSSWRLSPSSSGYKTLSLRSTDSITPSPTGGGSPEPSGGAGGAAGAGVGAGAGAGAGGACVVWCVTDLAAVPPGALVIHPQTGRPLTNADGSVYQFDPSNPPVLYDPSTHDEQQKIDQNNEKRRGRLEKQHSFIDNDCECQPSEECRSKCCCECRRHDACQQKNTSEKETNTKSPSPNNRYEANVQTNHAQESTNQNPPLEPSTNHKPPTETNQRQHESPNQRQVYENQSTNKQFENQRSFESTNQRQGIDNRVGKLANQESQELQYPQGYVQGYRMDELASPAQLTHYVQVDGGMQAAGMPAKITQLPIQDPNIRPMSLTNMVYPTAIAQGYPYQCRVDQPLQPMYQTLVQPTEEQKQLTSSPHATENTFRIDPSYPYAAVDFTAACGACVDTATLHHQQRSYNAPYTQLEAPAAACVGNVLLPPPHMQPYPYAEAVSWAGLGASAGKLMMPELYPHPLPAHYPHPHPHQQPQPQPHHYPHYNILYPQMLPQPYPVCQPVYPVLDPPQEQPRRASVSGARSFKRTSLPPSARNTPSQEEKVPYDDKNTEIAAKIQQIKNQMAQLNTRESERPRRDEWRRTNSGGGLLGNYPTHKYNGRVAGRPTNDESQLSSAARAIVNSIRNMQSKDTYQDVRRPDRYESYRDRGERRRGERDDEPRDKPPHPHPHADTRPRAAAAPAPALPAPAAPPTPAGAGLPIYRHPYLFRQMSPGTWCRRSPAPVHPVLNHPRRPHPDTRNGRR